MEKKHFQSCRLVTVKDESLEGQRHDSSPSASTNHHQQILNPIISLSKELSL